MRTETETIFVGLSGGVDSSVAAKRLIEAGHTVVGVFIKTWQPDFIACTWEAERLDAMRVAAHLGIPFLTCDAEAAYKDSVADYMISEYTAGRTPNPDVMCNRYVKFGAFLEFARAHGATKMATGHYARVEARKGRYALLRGVDVAKDQSYFLWTLTQAQLAETYFPIGDTHKAEVRREAARAGLPTSEKRDSQGICFLGQIDMQDFLSHYVETAPGKVLDETGRVCGAHEGALFYTMGQRHGFTLSTQQNETTPHYVIAKDLSQNTITVSSQQATIGEKHVLLAEVNLIAENLPEECEAQFRYRQQPFRVHVDEHKDGRAMITVLDKQIEKPSVGQSCVLYSGDACLGGGIISEIV